MTCHSGNPKPCGFRFVGWSLCADGILVFTCHMSFWPFHVRRPNCPTDSPLGSSRNGSIWLRWRPIVTFQQWGQGHKVSRFVAVLPEDPKKPWGSYSAAQDRVLHAINRSLNLEDNGLAMIMLHPGKNRGLWSWSMPMLVFGCFSSKFRLAFSMLLLGHRRAKPFLLHRIGCHLEVAGIRSMSTFWKMPFFLLRVLQKLWMQAELKSFVTIQCRCWRWPWSDFFRSSRGSINQKALVCFQGQVARAFCRRTSTSTLASPQKLMNPEFPAFHSTLRRELQARDGHIRHLQRCRAQVEKMKQKWIGW